MAEREYSVLVDNRVSLHMPEGATLFDVARQGAPDSFRNFLVAQFDGEIVDLHTMIEKDGEVHFFDFFHPEGRRAYTRSVFFLLSYAVSRVFPGKHLKVTYSISNGIFCQVEDEENLNNAQVATLSKTMQELAEADLPFRKHTVNWEQAINLCSAQGRTDLVRLFRYWRTPAVPLYVLDSYYDYYYGPLCPTTGYVRKFGLAHVPPGFIVHIPDHKDPESLPPYTFRPKLYSIFQEAFQWSKILEIENVGNLNEAVVQLKGREIVEVAEAFHEKKIAQIADQITQRKGLTHLVLIAGPSSSGKTTFARRLLIQLRANGWKPLTISLDDYFRERQELGEDNFAEYEKPEAIDLGLFKEQMQRLIAGEAVEVPHFNFVTGKREFSGKSLTLSRDGVIVVEGLHALNPLLSKTIPPEQKVRIFVSAITQLNIDDHNRISTTDSRLIRRLVRDSQFRGRDAEAVFTMWPHVREGEEKYVFPFQEEADIMFNSSLIYELSVLRQSAEPLLRGITPERKTYLEAYRLYAFLNHFIPLNQALVPSNSILREFIGRTV
ncbi:MAG TPA: hypothetical protein VLH40_05660 [Atribacteraceae bacterium]|nr:hypothetical protein [Atribacteraceae bacterium]